MSMVNLRKAKEGAEANSEPTAQATPTKQQPARAKQTATRKATPKEPPTAPAQVTPLEEAIARTRPRPMGKNRNPEFTQIGAYIRKTTKKAVELRLMQEDTGQDFSDLIESLLHNWLSG